MMSLPKKLNLGKVLKIYSTAINAKGEPFPTESVIMAFAFTA
jgi:hypothetical protein